MARRESLLGALIKGGLSGVVGTVVLTVAMQQAPRLLERAELDLPLEGETSGAGGGDNSAVAVEKLAVKVAQKVFDTHLTRKEKQATGQVIHWGYGIGWGMLYGLVQNTLRLPHALHGTLLAGLMGLAAATVIPGMRLVPSEKDLPPQRSLMQFVYILLFGWSTALVFRVLARKKT